MMKQPQYGRREVDQFFFFYVLGRLEGRDRAFDPNLPEGDSPDLFRGCGEDSLGRWCTPEAAVKSFVGWPMTHKYKMVDKPSKVMDQPNSALMSFPLEDGPSVYHVMDW
jgi:hypothetical protein